MENQPPTPEEKHHQPKKRARAAVSPLVGGEAESGPFSKKKSAGVVTRRKAAAVAAATALHERKEQVPSYSESCFDLPSAPVYHPTEEEFEDPLLYVSKIKPEAEKFGICKIVAPPRFRDFVLRFFHKTVMKEGFKFKTKLQHIHRLRNRHGPNEVFNTRLRLYLAKRGISMQNPPRLDGKEIDFYKMYTAVTSRGGYYEVTRQRRWKEIAKELRISSDCTSATYNLSRHYALYLLDYEESQRRKKRVDEYATMGCEVCKGLDDDENMLICDACNEGFHVYCLNPPLAKIPEGEWFCPDCDDFGYEEGKEFTIGAFEAQANCFKRKWLQLDNNLERSPAEIEEEYWRIVESSEDQVRIHYGSDVDVEKHASGFPRQEHLLSGEHLFDEEEEQYWNRSREEGGVGRARGWNLNLLPRVRGSVLEYLDEEIPGVTSPMLYIGMLFSSFCWHNEDNYLYSINYLHHGGYKTWYGVPGSAAGSFEQVMRDTLPDLFSKSPDLLHQLVTMVSPTTMAAAGVPVCTTVQKPGDFIITFPQAYHAGFSHGFNCAESVNFATEDWIPYGILSAERYRHTLRESVFSVQEVLFRLSQFQHQPSTARILKQELQATRNEEAAEREKLRELGVVQSVRRDPMSEPILKCVFCFFECFLSYVRCPCSSSKISCLRHSTQLCSCPPAQKVLCERVPIEDLDAVIQREEAALSAKDR